MRRNTRLSAFNRTNVLLIALLVLALGLYEIAQEQKAYRAIETNLQQQWHNSQQRLLRSEVSNTISYLRYRRARRETATERRLRLRVEQEHSLLETLIATEDGQIPADRIRGQVAHLLENFPSRVGGRFGQNFVITSAGSGLTESRITAPSLARFLAQRRIRSRVARLARRSQDGLLVVKPKGGTATLLVGFATFRPFGWIIGTAVRTAGDSVSRQDPTAGWLGRYHLGDDGRIWVFGTRFRPVNRRDLAIGAAAPSQAPSNPLRIGIESRRQVYVEMLRLALSKRHGGFVEYRSPDVDAPPVHEHLAYVRLMPRLGWGVGATVDSDVASKSFAPYRATIQRHELRTLISLLLLGLAAAVLSIVFNRYFHRRIRKAGERFNVAFREAATSQTKIEPSQLDFVDFQELAAYANRIIEDRRFAEERSRESLSRVQQAHKMEAVGRVAGGIAHDFNNILMVIMGYAETSLLSENIDESSRSALEEIRRSAKLGASLTTQLLAFSRSQVVEPTTFDLRGAVRGWANALRSIVGGNVRLSLDIGPTACVIHADANQIERALLNLAVNARDAMPNGGTVVVSVRNRSFEGPVMLQEIPIRTGRYVILEVRDEGVGMSHETLQHIFEPFYTTKARDKGTGLGLATVFGIVQQSGGQISVHSELGKGTVFRLYFDSAAPEDETVVEPEYAALPRGGTILVVEDDSEVSHMITSALNQAGYSVVAAASATEALAVVRRRGTTGVGVVVTDVAMPDMSGHELIERLRDRLPNVKVLLMTGYEGDEMPLRATSIRKPITSGGLLAKIGELLDDSSEQEPRETGSASSIWYTSPEER